MNAELLFLLNVVPFHESELYGGLLYGYETSNQIDFKRSFLFNDFKSIKRPESSLAKPCSVLKCNKSL